MLAPLSQLPLWFKGKRLETGVDFHIGSLKKHVVRGNHRHYRKTELIMVWGGHARWRLERSGPGCTWPAAATASSTPQSS